MFRRRRHAAATNYMHIISKRNLTILFLLSRKRQLMKSCACTSQTWNDGIATYRDILAESPQRSAEMQDEVDKEEGPMDEQDEEATHDAGKMLFDTNEADMEALDEMDLQGVQIDRFYTATRAAIRRLPVIACNDTITTVGRAGGQCSGAPELPIPTVPPWTKRCALQCSCRGPPESEEYWHCPHRCWRACQRADRGFYNNR